MADVSTDDNNNNTFSLYSDDSSAILPSTAPPAVVTPSRMSAPFLTPIAVPTENTPRETTLAQLPAALEDHNSTTPRFYLVPAQTDPTGPPPVASTAPPFSPSRNQVPRRTP
ncbi:hypothetical protein ACA910_001592 [Epithemia clementina (nom. ined.)]